MYLEPFSPLALAVIPLLPATFLADTPASTQWVVTSAKPGGNPCPSASVTYPFSGAKGLRP